MDEQSARDIEAPSSKERLWSPIFIIIIGATLACFLVGQGANAGTSVYLERIGGTTGLAGIGAFTFSIAAAVARIICGPVIDARGRALIMKVGVIVLLGGTIGPLFSNEGVSFLIWRVLQGCGFAAATTALATAAADVLPLSRLGEGIGYYGLGQAISMSVGPAVAIFLVSTDPPENFYLGLTAFGIIALLLVLTCRYERHPETLPPTAEYRVRWEHGEVPRAEGGSEEPAPTDGDRVASNSQPKSRIARIAESIFEPSALHGTIPILFIVPAFGFGIFFVGVLGTEIGVGNAGLFYSFSAITMILIRLTSGKFMDKVRPIIIMGFGVIFGILSYAMLLISTQIPIDSTSEWVYYLAGIPYGISIGVAVPIGQAVSVKLSPPKRWGAANAIYLLGTDIAIGLSSIVWGITLDSFGMPVTLIAIMALVFTSFFVALVCFPKENV